MKIRFLLGLAGLAVVVAGSSIGMGEPSLTIYNQQFAVVRDTVHLDLKAGLNQVSYADVTAHLEPDSVVLRDPAGKFPLRILEQNYRSDPVSEALLLSMYEGQTLEFLVDNGDGTHSVVTGRIIRSGYVPHYGGWSTYGNDYMSRNAAMASRGGGSNKQTMVEVDGKIQFGLPGKPLFPSLPDETVLKPTLEWVIEAGRSGAVDAELSYITGGMRWKADYNLVAEEGSDVMEVVGWVTMDNQSGKDFKDARIKLMAGDVSRARERMSRSSITAGAATRYAAAMDPLVKEKALDDFHLYTIERDVNLRDREMKQVEFLRASKVKTRKYYVYNGSEMKNYGNSWNHSVQTTPELGTKCNNKVASIREFDNKKSNHLGVPLPQGRVRFYIRTEDGSIEFVGDDDIDHTPTDETVKLFAGYAFDLVGERRQVDFVNDMTNHRVRESFEIKLRNHGKKPVEIRVLEILYRGSDWSILEKSQEFTKLDAHSIEFRVEVPSGGEKVITYKVNYDWGEWGGN